MPLALQLQQHVQFDEGRVCFLLPCKDFLAPYLLSSIDRGTGMIRMLNETPINYVTWGNHEAERDWCVGADCFVAFACKSL